eukprot:5192731-Alexandrium_andersonii.AAC.1
MAAVRRWPGLLARAAPLPPAWQPGEEGLRHQQGAVGPPHTSGTGAASPAPSSECSRRRSRSQPSAA